MSNEQIQPGKVFQMANIGKGNIILYTEPDSFYGQVFAAFNAFAIDIARSDLHLDVELQLQDVEQSFQRMEQGGLDTSAVDKNLQARYTKALEDLIETFVKITTSTLIDDYRRNQKIIYPH